MNLNIDLFIEIIQIFIFNLFLFFGQRDKLI